MKIMMKLNRNKLIYLNEDEIQQSPRGQRTRTRTVAPPSDIDYKTLEDKLSQGASDVTLKLN